MVGGKVAPSPLAWTQGAENFGGPLFMWTTAAQRLAASDPNPTAAPTTTTATSAHAVTSVGISVLDHFGDNAMAILRPNNNKGCVQSSNRGSNNRSSNSSKVLDSGDDDASDNRSGVDSKESCWLQPVCTTLTNASEWLNSICAAPAGTWMSTLVVSRPGLQRTTRAFGSIVRRAHKTTRNRDNNVKTLSYWSDNAAGYSWWSKPDNDIDAFGPIGDLYLRLHAEYMRAGIHFGAWESDNTFGRKLAIDSSGTTHGGWCFEDWTEFNTTLYVV